MSNFLETEVEYKGMTINVFADDDVESPADWGNEDVCFWNREINVKNKHITKEIFGAYIKASDFMEYKAEAKAVNKEFHIFPVDAYIHSGISLSLHGEGMQCKWDSSSYVGCIIVARSEARTIKQAEKIARGILETWNDYLQGNVYRYVCVDPQTGETIGSCSGFYGYNHEESGLLDNAREEIDVYLKDGREEGVRAKIAKLRKEADSLELSLL